MSNQRIVIFGNYVNAWALRRSLKKMHRPFSVYSKSNNLIAGSEISVGAQDVLLFTDEGMLLKYHGRKDFNVFPTLNEPKIIDDKWAQYEFLKRIGESPVPSWQFGEEPKFFPIYLKLKSSWMADRRLPRGEVIHAEQEKRTVYKTKRFADVTPEMCFFQTPLTGNLTGNISVSGFFDHRNSNRNCMLTTRKIWGCGIYGSTGTIVESTIDPENLVNRTKFILEKLQFHGPFELEFFRDQASGHFYVLELNCRFWMQHGIFIDHASNAVVRYSVDRYCENLAPQTPDIAVLWVDTIGVIASLLKGEIKLVDIVKLFYKKRAFHVDLNPGIGLSIWHLGGVLLKKLKSKVIRKLQ